MLPEVIMQPSPPACLAMAACRISAGAGVACLMPNNLLCSLQLRQQLILSAASSCGNILKSSPKSFVTGSFAFVGSKPSLCRAYGTEDRVVGAGDCRIRCLSSMSGKYGHGHLNGQQLPLSRSSGTVAMNFPASTLNRLLEWLGFVGLTKYSKTSMRKAGLLLYICATEYCNYRALLKAADLPDTFSSWFLLTELHVWMIMVRLANEGKEGRYVRNHLVSSMWSDVEARAKKILADGNSGKRREGMESFNNMFKGALFAYDEGFLQDDRVLAAALWRNMFDMKACEPQCLEFMVKYVRKQLWHLEKQDSALIVSKGFATFLPYDSETLDLEQARAVKQSLNAMR